MRVVFVKRWERSSRRRRRRSDESRRDHLRVSRIHRRLAGSMLDSIPLIDRRASSNSGGPPLEPLSFEGPSGPDTPYSVAVETRGQIAEISALRLNVYQRGGRS